MHANNRMSKALSRTHLVVVLAYGLGGAEANSLVSAVQCVYCLVEVGSVGPLASGGQFRTKDSRDERAR